MLHTLMSTHLEWIAFQIPMKEVNKIYAATFPMTTHEQLRLVERVERDGTLHMMDDTRNTSNWGIRTSAMTVSQ